MASVLMAPREYLVVNFYGLSTKRRSRWLNIGHDLFFCLFMDWNEIETEANIKTSFYRNWSIKDLLYGKIALFS